MSAMHPITPIIRTEAYSILRDTSRAALETARLGIVRGPVGIGKTFALRRIAEELSQGDDQVFLIEAPSTSPRRCGASTSPLSSISGSMGMAGPILSTCSRATCCAAIPSAGQASASAFF